jgi:DNA polymerase-4
MGAPESDAPALCRDCFARLDGGAGARCPRCGSPRLKRHAELFDLSIAHVDCDAFYAAVEKRDDPSLVDKPLIVGGGRRGVVSTCCYIARTYGVRSAMPMFKALAACPDAVVMRPNMAKYAAVGAEVRALMRALTPLVQPLSIDEAFLDLSGTDMLHRRSPAETLARLAAEVEKRIGISISVGLSHNKFLAKVASDLDKPRGFAVIGRAETMEFLAPRPVTAIWGVGKAFEKRLMADGITRIADIQARDLHALASAYGSMGSHIWHLARGIDSRKVEPHGDAKSISAETTFETDIADLARLERALWPLCETVSRRLKKAAVAGRTVTLKLKDDGFRLRTRARKLTDPTQLAETLFRAGRELLAAEADGTRYRLIGIGASSLGPAEDADPPDLVEVASRARADAERAMDKLRAKFGEGAVFKGRRLDPREVSSPDPEAPRSGSGRRRP